MTYVNGETQNIVIALPDLAAAINKEHDLFIELMRSGLTHAIQAGELLIQVKSQLKHGEWLPWLAANCHFSERTAQNYLRCAENKTELLAKSATVADLSYRDALALLTPGAVEKTETELLSAPTHAYISEIDQKVKQASTLEEIKKVHSDFRKIEKSLFGQVLEKEDKLTRARNLELLDKSRIVAAPVSKEKVLPLETGFKAEKVYNEIELFVNMWQKNFNSYCAQVGCWHPIENKPEWGTYHARPGWDAWGLEALGPPRANWIPVFCDDHDNGEDKTYIATIVRSFLAGGLGDYGQERSGGA
jgi:hypothetical protein